MWNHLRAKHPSAMADSKDTVFQKFGPAKQQSITSFTTAAKFSKEKHEECYKAAAQVCLRMVIKSLILQEFVSFSVL